MRNPEFHAKVQALLERAHGRWTSILDSLDVDASILSRRNQPCPLCGGTDRFQYTDKFGEGNYHCRSCGPGGGFKLLQAVKGIDFKAAMQQVQGVIGSATLPPPAPPPEPSAQRMKKLAKRLWDEAHPVTVGDDVDRYLRGRGLRLDRYPKVLRCHPRLGYYEKDVNGRSKLVAEHPAMLACIQGADGHAISLHRTYLQDGHKANHPDAKKVLSGGIQGAAVRLFEPAAVLALAEGIETAIAVHLATGKRVWAGISAGNLERLWLPEQVLEVHIYADNDADGDFDGQAAAFALARRLRKESRNGTQRRVQVYVPWRQGADWADVWGSRKRRAPGA